MTSLHHTTIFSFQLQAGIVHCEDARLVEQLLSDIGRVETTLIPEIGTNYDTLMWFYGEPKFHANRTPALTSNLAKTADNKFFAEYESSMTIVRKVADNEVNLNGIDAVDSEEPTAITE